MAERFCLVTTFYPPYHFGGDAIHAYRLANALARRGCEVTVVHSEDAYRALGGAEPTGAFPHEPGVRLEPLRTTIPKVAATLSYVSGRPALYAAQLERILLPGRFDVVHFHNVSLTGGPGVLGLGDGVKLYTTSEHWLVCPMHVLFRQNREPCVEPHCLRCTLAFGRPPQLWRYTGLLEREARHVDLFLAPSRFTLRAHRETLGDDALYFPPRDAAMLAGLVQRLLGSDMLRRSLAERGHRRVQRYTWHAAAEALRALVHEAARG